jgi:hypothetical protein
MTPLLPGTLHGIISPSADSFFEIFGIFFGGFETTGGFGVFRYFRPSKLTLSHPRTSLYRGEIYLRFRLVSCMYSTVLPLNGVLRGQQDLLLVLRMIQDFHGPGNSGLVPCLNNDNFHFPISSLVVRIAHILGRFNESFMLDIRIEQV